MIRVTTGLLLAIFFTMPVAAGAGTDKDDWDIEKTRAPSKTLDFETSEGTWISVDVAPDGAHIVFDLLGHIYEMPIDGGRARALTSGRSWNMLPRYSPDGRRIAFTSDRGGSNDLWVMDRDGGDAVNVSRMDLPVFQGTWSRDGRHLYGTALNMRVRFPAFQFNFHGKHNELIPPGGRTPVNHFQERPGEDAIYYEHNTGGLPAGGARIKRFDTRSGEITDYLTRPGGAASPVISPDGRHMAYVHRDDRETVLVVHAFGSREERVLVRDLDPGRLESRSFYGCYPNMAWHPDGGEVFFFGGGGIHAVDIESGVVRAVPFTARIRRKVAETTRFRVGAPEGRADTRAHRWGQPVGPETSGGVLYEALGDLWLRRDGTSTNLTRSAAHETNPVVDAAGEFVYYASWTDDGFGALYRRALASDAEPQRLTRFPSQYGGLALSPDGEQLAYVCGASDLATGTHLERQTRFELRVTPSSPSGDGERERTIADITWSGNRYAKRPPTIRWSPDGGWLYFTEYEGDALTLKRIHTTGLGEQVVYEFPHATRAVVSPDFEWVAFREYHRTFVTPYEFVGLTLRASAADELGFCQRVDVERDGDFTEWTADGETLYWTRGRFLYRKRLEDVLAGRDDYEQTDLAIPYEVAAPQGVIAFTNVRVLMLDEARSVVENATVVVTGSRIDDVGPEVEPPNGAKVYDLSGHTIMPGMFDAHGHYGSPISALNVIEQRLFGLHANLAYGVTTMYDVYGTTQKDFWVSDMLRAGKIDGPRIYSVGDPIFVTKYRTKMHRPITSYEDALEHARFNRDHGATALKCYSNHTRKARRHLIDACRELKLNLVAESFANPQMNLTMLLDGYTGIEHTMGMAPVYEDVLRLFEATEVGMTPTLIVVYNGPSGERYFYMHERVWEDEKLLHFYREDELIRHRRPMHLFDDDFYHMDMAGEMKRFNDRGVLLQMGAHGQKMGLGAHWEMEMLVHGGFSPHEAIAVATINGFTHHGLDRELGSIEPGKLADFVVLADNPLDDIRNTRSIVYVVKNGVVYSGEDAARVWPDPRAAEPMYFQEK